MADYLSPIFKRIASAILLLIILITIGTLSFMLLEGFSFWDAIYMTVITISTVGFREVQPLSVTGRIITMLLIIFGVGLLFYTLGTAIEYFFSDVFQSQIKQRRVASKMSRLKNHYIVCGYGRVGKVVCKELKKLSQAFVVIESDPQKVFDAEEDGNLVVKGDATEEKVLLQAGLSRARGIAACVGDDSDNVFITLTARSLEPEIFIVARANTPEVVKKLYRAGANRVIAPPEIGGKRIASMLTHPKLSEFLDIVSFDQDIEFQIEQYEIAEDSKMAGKTIGELLIRDRTGCVVLLVKYPDGRLEKTPRSNTLLTKGSKLIVLGTQDQLETFERTLL